MGLLHVVQVERFSRHAPLSDNYCYIRVQVFVLYVAGLNTEPVGSVLSLWFNSMGWSIRQMFGGDVALCLSFLSQVGKAHTGTIAPNGMGDYARA